MGNQLSVPQVMLSAPDRVKRSGEYSKPKSVCNRYFEKNEGELCLLQMLSTKAQPTVNLGLILKTAFWNSETQHCHDPKAI